ncbi:unnamed protein product [Mytilus edulis]|uniref:Hexosyltransferase n=1 Tax=Mytilus edulis TaxID=6550 RepID=A0A8S3SXD7_MYTED|nr:unnamed protein product [Mytilus edulis]
MSAASYQTIVAIDLLREMTLDQLLETFYPSLRNKNGEKYAVQSLRLIRAGIQRYYTEPSRRQEIDIISGEIYNRNIHIPSTENNAISTVNNSSPSTGNAVAIRAPTTIAVPKIVQNTNASSTCMQLDDIDFFDDSVIKISEQDISSKTHKIACFQQKYQFISKNYAQFIELAGRSSHITVILKKQYFDTNSSSFPVKSMELVKQTSLTILDGTATSNRSRIENATVRPLTCDGCFHNTFHFLINNEDICKRMNESVDILILIMSAPSKYKERNVIRETWLTYTKNNTGKLRHAFLLGESPLDKELKKKISSQKTL